MTRSQEIKNAIKFEHQALAMLDIDHNNKRDNIIRNIHLLNAELKAIADGKIPDEVITL